jgi:hypothetical protein
MKISPAYKRHVAAIKTGTYTHGMVIGLCRTANAIFRRLQGYPVGATASAMTESEFNYILARLVIVEPLAEVSRQQSAQNTLLDLQVTPKGTKRKNAPFLPFQYVALVDLQDIRIVGLTELFDGRWLPVYKVTGKNGDTFHYYHQSWQSGGNGPTVLAQGEIW